MPFSGAQSAWDTWYLWIWSQWILRILKNLSKDIYGEQDEQDGDPAGNPSRLLSNLFSRFLASFNNLELSSLTFHF